MNDKLRALYSAADADEDFARQLSILVNAPTGFDAKALVALAGDHGVDIAEGDLDDLRKAAPSDGGEPMESELEAVAGGVVQCSSGARFLLR